MPFRDNPQDDTTYFARRDQELLALRYPRDPEDDDDMPQEVSDMLDEWNYDPEDDDEEDDSDIEDLWDDGPKGGEG